MTWSFSFGDVILNVYLGNNKGFTVIVKIIVGVILFLDKNNRYGTVLLTYSIDHCQNSINDRI